MAVKIIAIQWDGVTDNFQIPTDFSSFVGAIAYGSGAGAFVYTLSGEYITSAGAAGSVSWANSTQITGLVAGSNVSIQVGGPTGANGGQGTSTSPGFMDTWFVSATTLFAQGANNDNQGTNPGIGSACVPSGHGYSGGGVGDTGGGGAGDVLISNTGTLVMGANGFAGEFNGGNSGLGAIGGTGTTATNPDGEGNQIGQNGGFGENGNTYLDINGIYWGGGAGGGTGAMTIQYNGDPSGGSGGGGGTFGGGGGNPGGVENNNTQGGNNGEGGPGSSSGGTGGIIFIYNSFTVGHSFGVIIG